ncbi:GNAT family N-acetyltransferase [Xylanimonas ulmi]|uniref:RimJ/RimL family protein N-acetyltransferase n=1 Tax=Xylanimonas ulmi TaxID=228973 RepID=A0A4Q7LZ53_9MICO|nr:GNAT family N-acetyltransferase [Xylanibacterium ulmi]RZS60636.1 RimJ/RimL family protein N-acetyltransferase [Xylanibacterium ulmi]
MDPRSTAGGDVVVRTDRLTLRRARAEDAEAYLAWRSLPDVMKYLYQDPWTAQVAHERLATWEVGAFSEPGDTLMLAVDGPDGVVGEALLRWAPGQGQVELGYAFHPDVAGLGYATEAGRVLLSVAFEQFGFHRAFARIDAENLASVRVAQRLGMRLEARFVENDWRPADGVWASELVYAVLASEHAARRRR